jgi:hypothetical protein
MKFEKDKEQFEKMYNKLQAYEKIKKKYKGDNEEINPHHTKAFYQKEMRNELKRMKDIESKYNSGIEEWKRLREERMKTTSPKILYTEVQKEHKDELFRPTREKLIKLGSTVKKEEPIEEQEIKREKKEPKIINPFKVSKNQVEENDDGLNIDDLGEYEIDDD